MPATFLDKIIWLLLIILWSHSGLNIVIYAVSGASLEDGTETIVGLE